MEEYRTRSSRNVTDGLYAGLLCVRSQPVKEFLARRSKPASLLINITSVSEGVLLKLMGLSADERYQIEGLQVRGASAKSYVAGMASLEQISSRAVVRLAQNPPAAVGSIQRRTANWLIRLYPNGYAHTREGQRPHVSLVQRSAR